MQSTLNPLQELVIKQREAADYFFDHFDLIQMEKIIDKALTVSGLVTLVGVGKSGIIAEKIAATLNSTGTRAQSLLAADSLHGDIGAVSKEDLIIILSKSGETSELLDLIPHIRKRGCYIIVATSSQVSTLAKQADLSIELPVHKELCPYDLAPTSSTSAQLFFGDLLAMGLMKEKQFSLEAYAQNHPAGNIGRKITNKVKDLMKMGEDLPICNPKDRLIDLLGVLSEKRCGCLVVVDEEKRLQGIFTDGDLRRALEKEGASAIERKIEEFMCKKPIALVPEELAHFAIEKMQSKRYVSAAPVVENGKVVGLVRMHDLIQENE